MATIPASENVFPEVLLAEVAAPAAAPSGQVRLYVKADGLLYWKDDAGTEYAVGQGVPDAADVPFDDTGLTSVVGADVQAALEATDAAIAAGGIPPTILDAQGDLIVASAADTAARLALGASGTVLRSNGTTAAWSLIGQELGRTEITSNVAINQSAQASAVTVVTLPAITGDGTYQVDIELSLAAVSIAAATGHNTIFYLYDGSAFLGIIGYLRNVAAQAGIYPLRHSVRVTPPASAVTYSIRATASSATSNINAGTGGTGAGDFLPSFARIVRVS